MSGRGGLTISRRADAHLGQEAGEIEEGSAAARVLGARGHAGGGENVLRLHLVETGIRGGSERNWA